MAVITNGCWRKYSCASSVERSADEARYLPLDPPSAVCPAHMGLETFPRHNGCSGISPDSAAESRGTAKTKQVARCACAVCECSSVAECKESPGRAHASASAALSRQLGSCEAARTT